MKRNTNFSLLYAHQLLLTVTLGALFSFDFNIHTDASINVSQVHILLWSHSIHNYLKTLSFSNLQTRFSAFLNHDACSYINLSFLKWDSVLSGKFSLRSVWFERMPIVLSDISNWITHHWLIGKNLINIRRHLSRVKLLNLNEPLELALFLFPLINQHLRNAYSTTV